MHAKCVKAILVHEKVASGHRRRKDFFQGGPTVVKFHFTKSKLTEKHFFTEILIGKYQTSKSRRPRPLPTPTQAA